MLTGYGNSPLNMNPAVRGQAPQPMSQIQPVAPAGAGRVTALNHAPAIAGGGEMPFTPTPGNLTRNLSQ